MARHLVAAGTVIDEDADLALQHATAARRLASRIAAVREAVGLAAYAAGDWATAIAELRTYHRMTGRQTHLAEIADCERALGRPERAIDLYRGADRDALDPADAVELLIVAAGARGDLGQHGAAVAMLQVRELTADGEHDWTARLRYAYADALLAAGRREESREWFSRAAAADTEGVTDASERLLELDGVSLEGDEDDHDDEDPETAAADTEADEFADADADAEDEDDADADAEDDDEFADADDGTDEAGGRADDEIGPDGETGNLRGETDDEIDEADDEADDEIDDLDGEADDGRAAAAEIGDEADGAGAEESADAADGVPDEAPDGPKSGTDAFVAHAGDRSRREDDA
nr:hypothetical protein [Mangrovihabitans endophyticus]